LFGYPAEQMVPNIRCGCCLDEYSKVYNKRQRYCFSPVKLTFGSLLNDPNTSSPANVEASNLYKDNRKEYTKRVRESVEKSWED
jgi:ubiquitin-protein ligase